MGRAPARRSAAITARPTGPQPITSGASSGSRRALATAWTPTAIGSVSAACSVDEPGRHRQQERLGEAHVLAVAARGVVGVADGARAGRAGRGPGASRPGCPTGSVLRVPGPYSTISAQNSWPMTTSRERSIVNTLPARRAAATNCSACLSACRSEPQMPQASVLTSTSPGPGSGTGRSATTSRRSRITAARMGAILPRLAPTVERCAILGPEVIGP